MLHITVLSVGTIKESYLTNALSEYEKRLSAYVKLTMKSCKEEPLPDDPTDGQIRHTVEKEGERLMALIPPRAYVVALCVEGKQMPSEAFASMIDAAATGGYGEIVFVIGGSFGLSDVIKRRAQLRLSFSQMTFPHQLMRVILAEQLYRAMNILGGGKYHK